MLGLCLQGMGRVSLGFPPWALLALDHPHNQGLTIQRIGCCTRVLMRLGEGNMEVLPSNKVLKLMWRLHKAECSEGRDAQPVWCGHHKWCTPEAIRGVHTLACVLCTHEQLLRAQRRVLPSEGTQAPFMRRLDKRLLPYEWVWEARVLPKWRGLIDIYIVGCQLMVQLDGAQHFESAMHEQALATQVGRDVACNVLAWEARARLVRLHYNDTGSHGMGIVEAAMQYAQQHPGAPLLVLSSSFAGVPLLGATGMQPYYQVMASHLNMQPQQGLHRSYWFTL